MAVTNYYTVNGSIIGESTNGVRTDYLMDALGSVTGTVNSSGQVINTYRYKPFGDLLSKSGTGADPAFGWVGTQGYKQTQKKFSNFYVRARHYGSSQGRWTTVDPYKAPVQQYITRYMYAMMNPIRLIDPTGLYCSPKPANCCDNADKEFEDLRKERCPGGKWITCPDPFAVGIGVIGGKFDPSKDCAQLQLLIEDVATTCVGFCSQGKGGGVYPPGTPFGAATYCCSLDNVHWKSCGTKCCSDNSAIQNWRNSAVDAMNLWCLLLHEDKHRKECDHVETHPPSKFPPINECCAYRAQMECLLNFFRKRCPGGANFNYDLAICREKSRAQNCDTRYK